MRIIKNYDPEIQTKWIIVTHILIYPSITKPS